MGMRIMPDDILNFWFYEIGRERWFDNDPALDDLVRGKFLAVYEQAVNGKLSSWEATPEGVLALLLLFDEFPRRMFRSTSRAFATDEQALDLARSAIVRHFDDRIDRQYKLFFYLPFLNSENLGDQRLALYYIRERTKEMEWLSIAEEHYDTVQKFGRFPQRNPILGRDATPEEKAFLLRERANHSAA